MIAASLFFAAFGAGAQDVTIGLGALKKGLTQSECVGIGEGALKIAGVPSSSKSKFTAFGRDLPYSMALVCNGGPTVVVVVMGPDKDKRTKILDRIRDALKTLSE